MQRYENDRGFRGVTHQAYVEKTGIQKRIVQESSAVGNYEDASAHPGSSYLWIGEHHHLSREEVRKLADDLKHWLENKRLPKEENL